MNERTKSVVTLLGLCFLVGCQTDALVGRRPVRGAPLTALESVEIAKQSDMSLAGKGEIDLVEQLVYHRRMYVHTLQRLEELYKERGYTEKHIWATNELADVQRIRPYHYLLDSEIPRLDLSPTDSIPDADALYEKALALAEEAGHGLPALYNREEMSQALRLFKQLIREYPSSDKIDDAAFYCGELHKEYFPGDEPIAVKWYELAWTWDSATPHPARFQAAVVYDYRLHQREKALELYRAAIAAETNKSNQRWAIERIKHLTQYGTVESERTTPVTQYDDQPPSAVGQSAPEEEPPAEESNN